MSETPVATRIASKVPSEPLSWNRFDGQVLLQQSFTRQNDYAGHPEHGHPLADVCWMVDFIPCTSKEFRWLGSLYPGAGETVTQADTDGSCRHRNRPKGPGLAQRISP